jgi:hypothetical protein
MVKATLPREATTSGLSDKQSEFVKHYSNGMSQTQAAKLAGYSSPGTDAWRLLRTQTVIDAISREMHQRLMTEGQQVALGFMLKAPANEKLPGAVRFQAAKWVMEAAGHGLAAQRAALGLPDSEKPLSEMSITELDAFLAAGRGAIAAMQDQKMRTIDGTARNAAPDVAAALSQVIDVTSDS